MCGFQISDKEVWYETTSGTVLYQSSDDWGGTYKVWIPPSRNTIGRYHRRCLDEVLMGMTQEMVCRWWNSDMIGLEKLNEYAEWALSLIHI